MSTESEIEELISVSRVAERMFSLAESSDSFSLESLRLMGEEMLKQHRALLDIYRREGASAEVLARLKAAQDATAAAWSAAMDRWDTQRH